MSGQKRGSLTGQRGVSIAVEQTIMLAVAQSLHFQFATREFNQCAKWLIDLTILNRASHVGVYLGEFLVNEVAKTTLPNFFSRFPFVEKRNADVFTRCPALSVLNETYKARSVLFV